MDTKAALRHFKKVDPVIHTVVKNALTDNPRMQLPVPKHESEYFSALVRSIVGQQITMAAAKTIFTRLEVVFGQITFENLYSASDESISQAGISKQKLAYIKSLISLWPVLEKRQLSSLSDDEVRAELTRCHGIGIWTADMFMIFTLGRPDVYSFNDLVLQKQLVRYYNLPNTKSKTAHHKIVGLWSPYKSIASLALWHCFE